MTQEEPHSTPGWVKVFGIVAAVLAVLVVIAMIGGGGRHGLGRHVPAINNDGTPVSNVTKDAAPGGRVVEHSPPESGH